MTSCSLLHHFLGQEVLKKIEFVVAKCLLHENLLCHSERHYCSLLTKIQLVRCGFLTIFQSPQFVMVVAQVPEMYLLQSCVQNCLELILDYASNDFVAHTIYSNQAAGNQVRLRRKLILFKMGNLTKLRQKYFDQIVIRK